MNERIGRARHRLRRRHIGVAALVALLLAVAVGALVHGASPQHHALWERVGLPGATVHAIALGRVHRTLAFAGTNDGIYRRDAGGRWTHVFTRDLVWSVLLLPDDRTVLGGDQSGNVDLSRDGGRTWQRHPVTPQGVFAVTAQPGTPRHLLAGGGGGLFSSVDGGLHWQRRLFLLDSAGAAFAWQPGSASTVFAGAVAGGPKGRTQVYMSHDAGRHWNLLARPFDSRGGIMALAVTPSAQVYAGTMGNLLWTVPAGGSSWSQLASGLPAGQHVAAIARIAGRPNTIVIGTLGAGVYRSDDSGTNWRAVGDGLPGADGARIVLSLAYALDSRTLLAGTTDGLYRASLAHLP